MVRFGLLMLIGLAWSTPAAAQGDEVPCAEREDSSPPAEAGPTEPGDEGEERARRLYLLGDDLYMQGRYDEALAAFEESYELSGRPLLLYNMANVYERSGEFDEALLKLEAYLPSATDEERPRLRARIESLRDRIERIEERQRQQQQELLRLRAPEGGRVNVPALLTTLGGVVLLGGGIGLAMLSNDAGEDLESECATNEAGERFCPTSADGTRKRELRTAAVADGLFVAAAGTVAIGIWLFLRGDGEDDEDPASDEAPTVDAWVDPTGAGMRVRGAF